MRHLSTLIFLIFTAPAILYARDISLDGRWKFRTDPLDCGIRECWFSMDHDTSGWDEMDVPGNWNTRMEYSGYTGAAWYSTEFLLPDMNDGMDVILDFEAVYSDADVWLNGKYLGSHDFGFTEFSFDISDAAVSGGNNRLSVRVDNSFKLGATWNWGGIRRPVTVKILPHERLDRIFIDAIPDLAAGSAQIKMKVSFSHETSGMLNATISGMAGEKIFGSKIVIENEKCAEISFNLDSASLWSFDHPVLYSATATYTGQDGGESSCTERFGIRKIETDSCGLWLNGERVRLTGANWVPYDPFYGNVLPEKIFKRDIDMMKECGVNMARLSHLALPENVLDYLDEKGMLIFEEIPLWNRCHLVKRDSPTGLRWLSELITQRYNHPCIIGWSAGNEIGRLSDNPDIRGWLESAFAHIRRLDPHRLAVYVTNTAAKQYDEPVLLSDIIMFNQYGAHGERADEVHRRYPGKPVFYSEYGTRANSEDLDNNIVDYDALLDSMEGRAYLVGASVWTFNDYRTNYRDVATAATGNRPWGIVDVYGNKKRGYDIFRRRNSPVEQMSVTMDREDGKIKTTVRIVPRGVLSLPAYTMRDYAIKARLSDTDNKTLKDSIIYLPEIKPGDQPSEFRFIMMNHGQKTGRLDVSLISPVGYTVLQETIFMAKPAVPEISFMESNQSSVRIRSERDSSAEGWYVMYGEDTLDMRSPVSISRDITVTGLKFGRKYRFRAVNCNGAGETEATCTEEIATHAAEMPPVIKHLYMDGKYIHIGYECDFDDFCYEFEYGLEPGSLDRRILTTVTGACLLPVIEEEKTHYLRIRKRLRYGYESEWSRIFTIQPH